VEVERREAMRVLILTWEFPPLITGGLGMACYGIVKGLLNRNIDVDLLIPAKRAVYFRLRKAEEADNILATFVEAGTGRETRRPISAEELRNLLGSVVSVYHTLGQRGSLEWVPTDVRQTELFRRIIETLKDEYYLFQQVKDFTGMAVDICSRLDFDVIHAHDWLTYPAGMVLKSIMHKPLVVHVHATEFDRAGGFGDGRIHNIEYAGMNYADRVITVSEYTANLVADKYRISRAKTRVVHNAYSLPALSGRPRRIFKEPTILFMGRITLQKGPDYFLEVARRVLQHEKNVRFIMAGSGDMERQVLHRAASLGLGTKFLVAGFLDRNEVEQILFSTDIFILPSVSEPFGIAPLEAMSYGAVAIISKSSGVAEVIRNAFKIDFWDIDQMVSVIIGLIRNPAKFREMSERGKAEVANLQWDEAVSKIMEVFRQTEEAVRC
jgi:glycosyltransferase involved in cell wall biosynthesis